MSTAGQGTRRRAEISTVLKKFRSAARLSVILTSALVALFASLVALLLVAYMWDRLQEVGRQDGGNSPQAQESVDLPGAPSQPEGAPKDEADPPEVPEKKVSPSEPPVEQEGARRGANSPDVPNQPGEMQ